VVPKNPRFAFVPWFASPQGTELYKLYVVTPVAPDAADVPDSPAVRAAVADAFGQYAAVIAR
jgi:hypothetical protein